MGKVIKEQVIVWLKKRLDPVSINFFSQRIDSDNPDLRQFLELSFSDKVKDLLREQGQLSEQEIAHSWFDYFVSILKENNKNHRM